MRSINPNEEVDMSKIELKIMPDMLMKDMRKTYGQWTPVEPDDTLKIGVMVGHAVIGGFVFATVRPDEEDEPITTVKALESFAVRPIKDIYKNTKRLMSYIMLSKEVQEVLSQYVSHQNTDFFEPSKAVKTVDTIVIEATVLKTTIAKYKDIMTFDTYENLGNGEFLVKYKSKAGQWTLKEAVAKWEGKNNEVK